MKLFPNFTRHHLITHTINTTSASCGSLPSFPLPVVERLSQEVRSVFIFRIAVNAISCPFVILLNIMVIVAVKTKGQLRSKSNLTLAWLATTDLVVGLVVQPLEIVHYSFMLKGETGTYCSTLVKVRTAFTKRCVMRSFNHLLLLSAEGHLAIKHPFAYENLDIEVRIIVASGLSWVAAILFRWKSSGNQRNNMLQN